MFTDKIKFFLFMLSVAFMVYVLVKVPINLGLDLQGGMRLVIEAHDTDTVKVDENAMQGVVAVLRNRVDGLGVSEPLITIKGKRQVVVELPGIKDPDRAVKMIGDTALMEFVAAEWLEGAASSYTTEDLKVLVGEGAHIDSYKVLDDQGKVIRETPIVLGKTVMTGSDLKYAGPSVDQYGKPVVSIEFGTEGAAKFAQVTREHVGKPLAILLDGRIISAPNINEPIMGGKAQISGSFTMEEVQDLVIKLKAGSLPVPVTIVEKKQVGPTLGKESVTKSIKAGIAGYLLVSVFMLIIYRYLGLMAIIALVYYFFLNMTALKLMHVTLTLPGIAGVILGLGVAVDANVLIFERYKEEVRAGKTVINALEVGLHRAMTAIVDSNLTTLLTAVVLFWLGSGTIKGFAITLSIGILISMFTALILTHYLLVVSLKISKLRDSWLVRL